MKRGKDLNTLMEAGDKLVLATRSLPGNINLWARFSVGLICRILGVSVS